MATSGGRRDVDELRRGIEAWLQSTRDEPVGINELSHPSAGLSNETLIVTLSDGQRLVVRLPPAVASFPDHDFTLQATVMEAARRGGVPVPAPVEVVDDTSWLGVPFLVMPFVDGHIPGPASVFDRWLTDATPEQQRDAQTAMLDTLGAIARVDWRSTPLPHRSLRDEVAWWASYLEWASDGPPLPRFATVAQWLLDTCPTPVAEPSLVWGDPRLENLIVDDDRRVIAVLDWELATVGPAEMDLCWYLGLERVLRELTGGMTVPGFRGDDELVADWEHAVGRTAEHVEWHCIFAVTRSICVNVRQAAISADAGVDYVLPGDESNPLLAVVERWIEGHEGD